MSGIGSDQRILRIMLTVGAVVFLHTPFLRAQQITVPRLVSLPLIDGNISEWKQVAFTDGLWDIYRLRQSPWYEPDRNRLTDHGKEIGRAHV